ncbi:MAG: arylesterase [Acidobacteria bacterium]|nr:arylesterase [Acidobacteriota bacterium]
MRSLRPCHLHVTPAALVLALVACGGAPSATRPDGVPVPGGGGPAPVVVALGDSLTAGPGLRREETYPARLQERIDARGYRHRVVDAGVSGDTTAGGLRRLEPALVPDTRVLIVALGANDGLGGVPVDQVRQNLSRIIEQAIQRKIKVLLTGMETPPTRGWQYTLDFHMIFPDLAVRFGVPLMPFLLTGVVGDTAFNLADGIHPNAAGARRIAENMWPYLEPLLIETNGG